jgi:hypothetical protein
MALRFYPRGELGKQGGNNPGTDANPPEDQEDTVERVEVSLSIQRTEAVMNKGEKQVVPPISLPTGALRLITHCRRHRPYCRKASLFRTPTLSLQGKTTTRLSTLAVFSRDLRGFYC